MNFKTLLESNSKKLLVFSDEEEREVKEFAEDNNLDKRQISLMKDSNNNYVYTIAYEPTGILYDTSFTVLRFNKYNSTWSTFDKVEHYLSKYSDPDDIIKDYMKMYKDRLSGFQDSDFHISTKSFKVNKQLADYCVVDINSNDWDTAMSNYGFKEID